MVNKKQNPMIKVALTTKAQLDNRKMIERETYDSVIVRLLEATQNEKQ